MGGQTFKSSTMCDIPLALWEKYDRPRRHTYLGALQFTCSGCSKTWSRCVQVESELKELESEEAAEFLASLGATESGLSSLVRTSYQQLGLRTYFTTGARLDL